MKLSDLKPGAEFEYIDQRPSFRRGKFLVLNICFAPINRTSSIAILSYVTKKVCNHWCELEVNVISKSEEAMENKMNHFIGWKFGVPVRVIFSSGKDDHEGRLFYEDDSLFRIITDEGVHCWYYKTQTRYELIPHKYGKKSYAPRYPICSNNKGAAFCNAADNLNDLGTVLGGLVLCPAATLNIDGKTIELSAETTAELKKKLEI